MIKKKHQVSGVKNKIVRKKRLKTSIKADNKEKTSYN